MVLPVASLLTLCACSMWNLYFCWLHRQPSLALAFTHALVCTWMHSDITSRGRLLWLKLSRPPCAPVAFHAHLYLTASPSPDCGCCISKNCWAGAASLRGRPCVLVWLWFWQVLSELSLISDGPFLHCFVMKGKGKGCWQ